MNPNEMKNSLQLADGTIGSQDRLTDWAKEPSVMSLQADLTMAKPAHDGQVSRIKRWTNLRNVEGSAKPNIKTEGRSKVQPKLVRRQNEWRYSALSEPFLSTEKAVQVSPTSWEDDENASNNEMVLNWQLRTKLNWVGFIGEYVRTCVDEGTVAVRMGWCRETVKEKVQVPQWTYYELMDPTKMDALQQAVQLYQANHQAFTMLPEDLQESVRYSMEAGVPASAEITGYVMAEQDKVVKNHPTIEVLDYENVYIDPTCNGDLSKANFVVFSFETSKAELVKDGRYKNLDKVLWNGASPLHAVDHMSRNMEGTQFTDDLRKRVVAYEYWGFYDVNGDDVLVPIVATWIGNVMIRMEENPFPDKKLPLVVVPYLPIKKSVTGEPDAELLEDNQSILGAVTRGMIDLLGRSANGQTGMAKGMLDAVNRKRYNSGADYEFNPNMPPGAGMFQHKYPEIPNSALTILQLQNQEAEALTGVKAFSGGLSGNAYGDVAAGVRGMLDAASKREMDILRRLAQGVEEIATKIVAMNQVFLSDEEIIRVTNKPAVKIRREDLAGNFDLKVDITTAEIEDAKSKDLSFMLQTIGNNMDFSMVKMILAEICRLKRMPVLAHAIEAFQPTPDPVSQKLQELSVQKAELELQELQSKIALNMAKAKQAGTGADLNDLDYVEQATGTKHARDMDKQSAQAEANSRLEITKRILDPNPVAKVPDVQSAIEYSTLADMLTKAQ